MAFPLLVVVVFEGTSSIGSNVVFVLLALLVVIRGTLGVAMGERLRVRDLRDPGSSTSSSSSSSGSLRAERFLAAERVTGPPRREDDDSCPDSSGVGLGEMTRGLAGTVDRVVRRVDMVREKGGRDGQGMAPTTMRRKVSKCEGQEKKSLCVVERR